MSALPWEALAGLHGSAKACTCSDEQLAHVGCDCEAQQNLPVQCANGFCGLWLRTAAEINAGVCSGCRSGERNDFERLEEAFEHYARGPRNGA